MSGKTWDRILIHLAVLAPLALLLVTRWQASLESWYAPLDDDHAEYLGADFERNADRWLHAEDDSGARLYVIADRLCPCTGVSLKRLNAALTQLPRRDVRVIVKYLDEVRPDHESPWTAMLRGIPATPTLLVVDGRQLLYAGPVLSGSFCTNPSARIFGLGSLQSADAPAILNRVATGCYCRIHMPQSASISS